MSGFNDRLLGGLDAAAERTGVPGMVMRPPRRRQFRWLPIAALLVASAGMVAGLVRTDLAGPGYAVIMLGFALAVLLPIIGPIKPWGAHEIVDEFDRAMRLRAFLAGFASVSVAALAGIWVIVALGLIGGWPSDLLIRQLSSLAFYLMVIYSAVPTLYSSWATRPIGDED